MIDYNAYDGLHENETHCTMVILELGSLPHLPRNFSELVPKSYDLQNSFGSGKMAQQLKALAALPGDRSLVPRAHTVAHKTTCDPSPKGFNTLSWPPWVHMLFTSLSAGKTPISVI